MRLLLILLLCSCQLHGFSQKAEYLIVVTTDGLRWQEVFNGMDTSLANSRKYNEGDSSRLYSGYYAAGVQERRKKLMPFLWKVIGEKGQLYGNRKAGNLVNNKNPYWFSYPGYSEIFTGYADISVNSNEFPPNPNTTILDFFQQQPRFKNKVAAFGAWDAFDRILNEERAGFPVISAFDTTAGFNPTSQQRLIDRMLTDSYRPWGAAECLDVFTHAAAMNYLKEKQPSVLYISYGETDEWAHAGKYRSYLDAAHQVDRWIEQLWNYVQQDPKYKNKTALLITTDHGRGDVIKSEWTSHGSKISDASEIWMALLGPGVAPGGEVTRPQQLYQQQAAQTMAHLLGLQFSAPHPVADAIPFKD
ncbi:MAG: alkaline phosphatase family protein [Sphingobacteriia bacterium]|nr:alkaline phosphatase family protein [Sphingobacteriia bacterium]